MYNAPVPAMSAPIYVPAFATMLHELVPTCIGLDLLTVVPSPNWPLLLPPQVYNAPTVLIPVALPLPALTMLHELVPICTGLDLLTVVPSPKLPN